MLLFCANQINIRSFFKTIMKGLQELLYDNGYTSRDY